MNNVVRVDFIKTMTFQERLAGSEGDGQIHIQKRAFQAQGTMRLQASN